MHNANVLTSYVKLFRDARYIYDAAFKFRKISMQMSEEVVNSNKNLFAINKTKNKVY